jgi:hypothetical protein
MKMPSVIPVFAICALFFALPSLAQAAEKVSLAINRSAIHFPDVDPDTVSSIAASENPLTIQIKVTGNPKDAWRLEALASGDLVSGSNTIPISNVSWTAKPLPLIDGKLSRTTPQVMASGSGNVSLTGTIQFYFKNSWNYAVGNYSQMIIYTLSVP